MSITCYHSKYHAYQLSRSGSAGIDQLGRALFDATVEINPPQIEAVMFNLRSPLSNGVLLPDEAGLGKSIEAGLVLCQYWAKKCRKFLIITPPPCESSGRWSFRKNSISRLRFWIPTPIWNSSKPGIHPNSSKID